MELYEGEQYDSNYQYEVISAQQQQLAPAADSLHVLLQQQQPEPLQLLLQPVQPFQPGILGSNSVSIKPAMDAYEPFVRITVQPQSRALRFRYKCEGRYPGALTGVGTTNDVKTYPQIRVENYVGKFVVVISCVTKEPPYYPHPHNIVSKEGCRDGVYSNKFDKTDMTATFTSLGIQCVKKTEVLGSLDERAKLRIDPFKTNYEHRARPGDIDLNAVRLCFQVFIEPERGCGRFNRPLAPVVSDVIFDRKAMSDLQITKLSHILAPLRGGLEMIVLCDKVSKDDIEVYFYQEDSAGNHLWEKKAEIQSVHKQVAVCFKSPNCLDHVVTERDQLYPVKIHLRRTRVNELGEGRDIYLVNLGEGGEIGGGVKRKRSGADQNAQMQAALLATQGRLQPGVAPLVVGVPVYGQPQPQSTQTSHPSHTPQPSHSRGHDTRRQYAPSPHSDDSPAPSPQQWVMQPLIPSDSAHVVVGTERSEKPFNGELPHGGNNQDPGGSNCVVSRKDPLDAVDVNAAAEKLDSLDISIPSGMSFISNSDINLNNLNMADLQMSGPTATPVILSNVPLDSNLSCHLAVAGPLTTANGNHPGEVGDDTCPGAVTSNLTLPGNFSESMFESGTSINQLDLLNSGQLRQLKQEEE
ncbi:proto-oncogene c-Rel-like isoform X2 [Varroa jacobsoni]|uniref:RHD domain-containing protein n=1 Tax=Varroa destructor TaxID=109461 RepID=A0A7M7MI23_VARDE|nr:proto-oncogene c-Rel-like isoform X3 [Varroa destructor]XP_022699296.1 proto-oncogene c-Rel-like isoform X2 [Varroa jacobsoni]